MIGTRRTTLITALLVGSLGIFGCSMPQQGNAGGNGARNTLQDATSGNTNQMPSSTQVAQAADAKCILRENGVLPDPKCSPGDRDPRVTQDNIHQTICVSGYTKTVRNVPQSLKDYIYSEYGIKNRAPGSYEIDHIISLQLGGSNTSRNLFPEAYNIPQGAHEKDVVETRLKRMVCKGQMSLAEAQRIISTDWRKAPSS